MGMESVFKLSVVLNMMDNMSDKLGGAQKNVGQSLQAMNAGFGGFQKAGAVLTGIGGGILGASAKLVTATFDTQDALGELKSLGVEDLKAVEDAARSFTNTWAGTSKAEFITASYDIKSGIASLSDEGVAKYTELAGLTAKATKSTTGEMTSLFATGYGIYKGFYSDMSDMEFGEMFSAGISTAVKNYKTSGSEMAASISTLGASATNAGVSMEEQLAILGQLQSTMSGSEAGTKYKAFLNAAAGAGKKLGLTFTDSNNQLLSMPEILTALKGKYGDTIDAVEKQKLKEAFGTDEAIALIDLLYGDIDGLSSGIDGLQESMQGGAEATQTMAEAINNTPAQKLELIKQQLHNSAESLASGLLPGVNSALEGISKVISAASDWVANNQGTVDSIMQIAVKIGIALVAAGLFAAVFGTIGKAATGMVGTVGSVMKVFTGRNRVFTASPILFIVVAAVALISIFKKLYAGSETFRNLWDSISSLLPQVVQLGIQTVMNLVQSLISALPNIISTGTQIIISLIQGLASALPLIISSGAQLIGMLAAGVITNLPNIIMSGIEIVFSLLNGLISAVPSLIAAIPTLFGPVIDAILSVDWLQVGIDIITAIVKGLLGALGSLAGAVIDGIKSLIDGDDAESAGADTVAKMAGGMESGVQKVSDAAGAVGNAAKDGLGMLGVMDAGKSGFNLAGMFGTGISKGAEPVGNAAGTVGGAALQGFSLDAIPQGENLTGMFGKGVLSGMDTAGNAATMVGASALQGFNVDATLQGSAAAASFENGMSGSSEASTAAASVVSDAWTEADSKLAAIWSALPDKFRSAWSQVEDGARRGASAAVSSITNAFSNMDIRIPRPKLPKISVAYNMVGSGDAQAKVPNFSVSYFARGGIMRNPTKFGRMPGGSDMVGGESGAEGIIPLAELWKQMWAIFGGLGKEDRSERQGLAQIVRQEYSPSRFREKAEERRRSGKQGSRIIIQNLNITVDMDEVDDLEKLSRLIEEIEHRVNGEGNAAFAGGM